MRSLTRRIRGVSAMGVASCRERRGTHREGCVPRRARSATRLLAHLEGLDDVAFLDVVEGPEADTALEALADLRDVVLLAAQGVDGEVVPDDDAVPQHAGLGIAPDDTGADDRAGDVADLGGAEHLADLRGAQLDLLVLRLEHALERLLDVLDRLVDDRVVPDVDTLAVGELLHPLGGPDVEADDHGVVDRGEVDVVLRDRTDAAVDDPQRDLVAHVDLEQRVLQRLDGTGHVALEDEVEGLDLALLQRLVEVLQRDALAALGQGGS